MCPRARRGPRRLAPLVATLVVLGFGCGPDRTGATSSPAGQADHPSTPREVPSGALATTAERRLAAAPAATIAAGSARTTFVATRVDGQGAGPSARTATASFDGEGEVDFENKRAWLRSDLTPLLREGGTAGVDGELESIVDGHVSYVRSPLFTVMLGAPTPWIRSDPAALQSVTGMDMASMTRLPGLGVNELDAHLAFLAGVVEGSVQELGAGEVRGTPTTRLRAVVDLRKAAEDAGAVTDPQAFDQFLTSLGSGELAVEVELDGDDRVRRLAYEHQLPSEGGGGHQRMEVEYFDFGSDVAISVPPDDQVTDLSALLGAGG